MNLKSFIFLIVSAVLLLVANCDGFPNGGGGSGGKNSTDCSEDGYFPNDRDCKKFYRCYEHDGTWRRADFDCPPGQVYDTDLPPGHCSPPWALNPNNKCYKAPE